MTAEVLDQRLGEVVAKLENFDGFKEVETTVGRVRLLRKLVAKLKNFDGLREVEATLGQLRLLGKVVAKKAFVERGQSQSFLYRHHQQANQVYLVLFVKRG